MVLRKHLVAFDVKIRTASSSTLVLKESEVGRGQKGTHDTTVAPSRNYFHKYSRDFYLTTHFGMQNGGAKPGSKKPAVYVILRGDVSSSFFFFKKRKKPIEL